MQLEVRRRSRLSGDVLASVDTLVVKETTRVRSQNPLLPYIFFNENEFALPTGRYEILNPERNPLRNFIFFPERLLDISEQSKNTLNIIAKRLWDNPEMKINVIGCNSGWGPEKGNVELSRRRAEAVRDYLVNHCSVRPEQVAMEIRQKPEDPASNEDPRGREENRRVEITCQPGSELILEPIITETTEISTSDSLCIFQIKDVLADAGLRRWEVVIVQAPSDTFKIFQGEGYPSERLMWNWKNDAGQSVRVEAEYRYRLSLWDSLGQSHSTDWKGIRTRKLRTREEQYVETNVEKTRLILFKYDRADMELASESLQRELSKIVGKMRTDSATTMTIHGHTDIIGRPDYNMNLSIRRAQTVANVFVARNISEGRISYGGFGLTKPLLDNNLPEGRMVNRRVEIYIAHSPSSGPR